MFKFNMYLLRIFYVAVVLFTFAVVVSGQVTIVQRLDELAHQANIASRIHYDLKKADSLSMEAQKLAESELNGDELLYKTIMDYLLRDKYGSPPVLPVEQINKITRIENRISDPLKKFNLWIVFAERLLHRETAEISNQWVSRAMTFAAVSGHEETISKALLLKGQAELKNSKITDAYDNFLDARRMISNLESVQKKALSFKVRSELCKFYSHPNVKMFAKARTLKQELINEITSHQSVDSLALMWSYFELIEIVLDQNPDSQMPGVIDAILSYCNRHNNTRLKEYTMAVKRGHLLENFDLEAYYAELKPYYTQSVASNSELMTVPELCFINALFCEQETKLDSAEALFKQAINASQNRARQANLRRRYAEFLLRHDREKDAFAELKLSLKTAKETQLNDQIIKTANMLDNLAMKFGDYKGAYEYLNIKLEGLTNLSNIREQEKLVEIELNARDREEKEKLIKEKEEKRKKDIRDMWLIGVLVIFLFLVLAIVSSMKVAAWVIEMLSFFNVLFVFEFLLITLEDPVKDLTNDNKFSSFLIKVAVLSVFFPLHHVVEKGVTNYMVKRQLIKRPKKSALMKFIGKMYPWLDPDHEAGAK